MKLGGWFVVMAHPQMERVAVASVSRLGFPSIFPSLIFGSGRPSPLFSRYVFTRIEAGDENWRSIWRAHGVSRILGGEFPHPVPEGWFERLLSRLDELHVLRVRDPSELLEFLPGDVIRVVGGMFDGRIAECLWSSVDSVVVDLMMGQLTSRVRLPLYSVEHYPRRTLENSLGRVLG